MPWWRKKKKDEKKEDEEDREDNFLSTPYRPDMIAPFGLGFEILMRELNRALEQMINNDEVWRKGGKVYGFSVTIGPDGRPMIREFGKEPKSLFKELEDSEASEATRSYDVIDLGDQVEVIAELKDTVKEGEVKVRGNGGKVIIESRGRKSVIKLPYSVRSKPERVIIRNGVIDVIFEKK